jgi:hypothetical protein
MSSWSSCPAYSGNPDKEAMFLARCDLRDKTISQLNEYKQSMNKNDPRICTLQIRCENLKHACAKYLIYTSWMVRGVGGSIIHSIYPETKEQADSYIANLERLKNEDLQTDTWAFLHKGYDYKNYDVIDNQPHWWDRICCD